MGAIDPGAQKAGASCQAVSAAGRMVVMATSPAAPSPTTSSPGTAEPVRRNEGVATAVRTVRRRRAAGRTTVGRSGGTRIG